MISNGEILLERLISHTTKIENSAELLYLIDKRRKNKDMLPNFNKALVEIS